MSRGLYVVRLYTDVAAAAERTCTGFMPGDGMISIIKNGSGVMDKFINALSCRVIDPAITSKRNSEVAC